MNQYKSADEWELCELFECLTSVTASSSWMMINSKSLLTGSINVREHLRGNQKRTIQRNWRYQTHKTKDEDKRNKNTTQHVSDSTTSHEPSHKQLAKTKIYLIFSEKPVNMYFIVPKTIKNIWNNISIRRTPT